MIVLSMRVVALEYALRKAMPAPYQLAPTLFAAIVELASVILPREW
jgi:hypothetical protein